MDEEEINRKLSKAFTIAAKISYWGGLALVGIAFNWLLALAMFLVISGMRHLIDVRYETPKTACSYHIHLSVCPKWEAIWEHCFSGLSVDEIVNDPTLKIDSTHSLYFEKSFSYDIFICENPPLKLIWSHHYQKFVEQYFGTIIRGSILQSDLNRDERDLLIKGLLEISSGRNDPVVKGKIRNALIGSFSISPDEITFSSHELLVKDTLLAQIPCTLIIQALVFLHRTPIAKNEREYKKALSRLKIIGTTLKKQLDVNQVDANSSDLKYLWSDDESRDKKFMENEGKAENFAIGHHLFETKFYSLSLTLSPFDSANVDSMSTFYRPF